MPNKLLLADDSVTIQRVIELTFADEDVDVIAVGDGQRAIEAIERDRPDIVLADVGMPERDGYEVAAFVKQHPTLSHVPVVLLTGAFEPVDEARARDIGCDGVLVKPFEPQVVINRVKDLLSGRGPDMPWESSPQLKPAEPAPEPEVAREPEAAPEPGAAPESEAASEFSPPPGVAARPEPPEPRRSLSAEPANLLSAGGDEAGFAGVEDPLIEDYIDQIDAAFSQLPEGLRALERLAGGRVPPPRIGSAPGRDRPPAEAARAPSEWDAVAVSDRAHKRATDESPVVREPTREQPLAPVVPRPPRTPPPTPVAQPEPIAPSPAAAPPERAAQPRGPSVARPQPRPGLSAPPGPPSGSPVLAEAFAALLAAEQSGAASLSGEVSPAQRLITDELIEAVTRRILERLSDQVVRRTVGDIVSQIAERLVREEIEHI